MTSLSTRAATPARVLLGTLFLTFGLNGFLNFIPQPAPPEAALTFLGGLASAGYFFPMLKSLEVLAGVALLTNRFVPLALAVLAPIVVNITTYHVFLAPAGLGLALSLLALELFLAWSYRATYRPMLAAKVTVAHTDEPAAELGESHGILSSH